MTDLGFGAALSFNDPEAFGANFAPHSQVSALPTARGAFHADFEFINLQGLRLSRTKEVLPRVGRGQNRTGGYGIVFGIYPVPRANSYINGMEVSPADVIILSDGDETHNRLAAGCEWGTLWLPNEEMAAVTAGLIGHVVQPPSSTYCLTPPPVVWWRLLELHEKALEHIKPDGSSALHPEVVRAMNQVIMHALVSCISGGEAVGHARHRDRVIMNRLEQFLEANHDRPLYVQELCKATGAPERSLRHYCYEQIGMSPIRYLRLRRMQMARRALRAADPRTVTVAAVANDHGFGELGRFAVTYRALFGETPSVTLQRSPEELKKSASPWHLAERA